uniref:Uncharacterized protein n=1 Tax=Solanum lycopersicum TaxID=4081 RepID=A0A3Q7HZD8_SOLLC
MHKVQVETKFFILQGCNWRTLGFGWSSRRCIRYSSSD